MSFKVALLAVLVGVCSVLAEYTQPTIWPQPKSFITGDEQTNVLPFKYVSVNGDVKTLTDAYERNNGLIFNHAIDEKPSSSRAVYRVDVRVDDNSESYPQLTTDESYTLDIPAAGSGAEVGVPVITITAKTVYGALHALQSLSQLVVYDFDADNYFIPSTPMKIDDAPRYPHRGMLLDTSRHYQPISFMRQTIDALSYAKYNVLHWHAVDTQSFPFESKSYEKLWDGAYTNAEKYSRADVKQLVEYGRARGVKIMIEFDMPGHAASWCKGYPEICPSTTCLQPLDPSSNVTFPLITSLLAECTGADVSAALAKPYAPRVAAGQTAASKAVNSKIASANNNRQNHARLAKTKPAPLVPVPAVPAPESLFPYSLLHLGGDEVSYTCWEQDPEIVQWEADNGINGSEGTYEYFVDRVATIARDQARTPVQWVEVFEHFGSNLDQNTVVHVWKAKSTMDAVLTAGYNALLSDEDLWYLDHLSVTWDQMYGNEPTAGLSATSDPSLILGGESCMWAETVDPSDLHNTVWPRAAAVAEVLWTPYDVIHPGGAAPDLAAVEDRLETFRCLLTRRGISAAPVTNTQARYAPKEPNSCFVQRRRL